MGSSHKSFQFPCGYHFFPTDEQLVLHYLLKKVRREPYSSEMIADKEIYGDKDMEPWKIFGENSLGKFYFFTKLKKQGEKGTKNMKRRAGSGTWKMQRTDPVHDSRNNEIGFKRLFVFKVKGSSTSNNGNKGRWLMHEYSLPGDQSDYVLCEIRNKRKNDTIDDYMAGEYEAEEFTNEQVEVDDPDQRQVLNESIQGTNNTVESFPATTNAADIVNAQNSSASTLGFDGLSQATISAQGWTNMMLEDNKLYGTEDIDTIEGFYDFDFDFYSGL